MEPPVHASPVESVPAPRRDNRLRPQVVEANGALFLPHGVCISARNNLQREHYHRRICRPLRNVHRQHTCPSIGNCLPARASALFACVEDAVSEKYNRQERRDTDNECKKR